MARLAARHQRRRAAGRRRFPDPARRRALAALSLDRRRPGGLPRRLGREPAAARLSRADAGARRGRGRRRRRGAAPRAQGRAAARRAGAHAAAVGAGRPAQRRPRGRQPRLQGDARGRADGLPRPARADRPVAARRQPGAGARLCRARLRAQAADAVGRAFAVRHAGAAPSVAGGAGHARRRHAAQGGERRPGRTLRALLLVERSRAAEHDGHDDEALGTGARSLRPRARAHRRHEPARRAADQDGRRPACDEDPGARLVAGTASRPRRALSQGVGRERSAEAGRRGAQARRAEARRHGKPSGARPGDARRRPVGRGAAASRGGRRQQSAGARLPDDGRARGARRRPTRPRCATGWRVRPRHRPTGPGAARPAARITRPGIRCARAAAPSAPCIGARRAPTARSWRPAARPSRQSA